MFQLNKKKIFFVYHHYLACPFSTKEKKVLAKNSIKDWKKKFLTQEVELQKNLELKLNSSWTFSRVLPLERAILMYGAHEICAYPNQFKVIINQIINFSKIFLEGDKYKYINKVLDLFTKEKLMNSLENNVNH